MRSLHRSIDFYAQVFGFDVIEVASSGAARRVLMSLADRSYLDIQQRGVTLSKRSADRWRLLVDDLDQVQQNLWDFGVPVGNDPPLHSIHPQFARRRSLFVRDPDGHEIEVVQRSA